MGFYERPEEERVWRHSDGNWRCLKKSWDWRFVRVIHNRSKCVVEIDKRAQTFAFVDAHSDSLCSKAHCARGLHPSRRNCLM